MKLLYSLLTVIVFTTTSLFSHNERHKDEVVPVMILGGGVGALTSAIYLQRAGIPTIVVEGKTPGGAIAQSPQVHNWPGEIEIDGHTLVNKILNQAKFNGATILDQEVISVDFSNRPFTVVTREINDPDITHTYKTQACILALGSTPKLLGIPGESGTSGYWTKGVYNCAVCDGALYRNKIVAVIGGGDTAVLEANYLSNIAKKVYVILRSDHFRTAEQIRQQELLKKENVEIIYNTQVGEIQGDGNKVTHLKLSTSGQLPIDGVFVAIGATPTTSLLGNQIELDSNGYVVLKKDQETSIPGVFAIGDVADPIYKQAISAAGDGAKAAGQVEHFLATIPKEVQTHSAKPRIIAISSTDVHELQTEADFYDALADHSTPLVVDFYSPYCGPCRQLSPEFDRVAGVHRGKIRFMKINVTQNNIKLAEKYNISGVPTVVLFINEKVVKKAQGLDEAYNLFDDLASK